MTPSDIVTLPVGLRMGGNIYRKVHISEMNGFDEENMSSKRVRNNGAKAQTLLLRRCIQEIEGLVPRKSNANDLIDEKFVLEMTSYDRDFLFFAIRLLGEIDEIDMQYVCSECEEQNDATVTVSDLEVYDWDDSDPVLSISMLKGFLFEGEYYSDVKWKFITGRQMEALMNTSSDRLMSATIAASISSVEGMKINPTEEMVRRLPSRERIYMLNEVAMGAPGIQTTLTRCCDSCGADNDVSVDVTRFFNSTHKAKKRLSPSGSNTARKRREH